MIGGVIICCVGCYTSNVNLKEMACEEMIYSEDSLKVRVKWWGGYGWVECAQQAVE